MFRVFACALFASQNPDQYYTKAEIRYDVSYIYYWDLFICEFSRVSIHYRWVVLAACPSLKHINIAGKPR
jgi:hypothetical protein